MAQPSFSEGSDIASLSKSVSSLTSPPHPWTLSPDGRGLEQTFKFKTFKAAWAFMDAVAEQCKVQRHHPEWSNVYNTVFVRWTTHNPRGLSEKDVAMAEACSKFADENGVIESGGREDVLRETAGRVVRDGGDCCDPKGAGGRGKAERQEEKRNIEAEEGATDEEGGLRGVGGQPS